MPVKPITGLRRAQPTQFDPVQEYTGPSGAGEIAKGIRRGTANIKAGYADVLRLGTDALGFESASSKLDKYVESTLRKSQKFAPRVKSLKDVEGAKDLTDFLVGGVAESAPFLATTLAGGGAGSLAAKALSKSIRKGAVAGAFGATALPETGFTYRETEEETGKKHPGLSVLAGTAKGALDVFSLGKALKSFLPANKVGTALKEIGKSAVREGSTEFGQELIDMAAVRKAKGDDVFAPLTPEEFQRGLDVAALGAAGGTAISTTGVATRKFLDREVTSAPGAENIQDYLRKGYAELSKVYGEESTEKLRASMGDEAFTELLSQMSFEQTQDFTEIGEGESVSILNKDSDPWPSLQMWQYSGVQDPQDALAVQKRNAAERDPLVRKEIREMRAEGVSEEEIDNFINEQAPYERASYLDYLSEQKEPADLEAEADRLATKYPKFASVRDSLGAEGFLEQFEYVKRVPIPEALDVGADPLARPFSEEELRGPKGEQKQSRAIIRDARFNKATGKNEPRFGEVLIRTTGTKKGKEAVSTKAINLQALVNAMMRRIPTREGDSLTDRVANALYSGVTSLATMEGIKGINLKAFSDMPRNKAAQVVVYQQKTEGVTRQITLAEVQTSGAARKAAKAYAAKLRVQKALEKVQTIERRMDRLRNIPVEISKASDRKKINQLETEYIKLAEDATELERDRQTAVKEMQAAMSAEKRAASDFEKAKERESIGFDPREDIEEVVKTQDEIEPVKKEPISRGYTQSDNPNTENLFNFNQNDELFEAGVGSEDVVYVAENLVDRIDELKALIGTLKNKPSQNQLAGIYHAVHRKVTDGDVDVNALMVDSLTALHDARQKLTELRNQKGLKFSKGPYDDPAPTPLENVESTVWESHPGYKRAAKLVEEYTRKAGLKKTVLLNPRVVNAVMRRVAGAHLDGFAVDKNSSYFKQLKAEMEIVLGKDAVDGVESFVYVNPTLGERVMRDTAAHETGHVIFYQTSEQVSGSTAKKMLEEFAKFVEETGGDKRALLKNRPDVLIRNMIRGIVPGTSTFDESLRPGFIEYVNDFEEWFADKVRDRLVDPAPAKNAVHALLDGMIGKFSAVFNLESTRYNSVSDYVDSLIRRTTPFWQAYQSPEDVLEHLRLENKEVHKSETPESGNDVPPDLLRQISEFYNKVLGRPLNRRRDAALIARMANLQNADAIGAAFNEAFKRAMEDGTLFTTEEHKLLTNIVTSPHVRRQLRALLGDSEAWQAAKNDENLALAYTYQFWMTHQIDLSNRTRSLFQKIYDMLREIMGFVNDNDNAEFLLQNFTNGRAALRKASPGENHFAVETASRKTILQKAMQDYFVPMYDGITESLLGFPLFSAANQRMRQTKVAALRRLGNMMGTNIDSSFEGADMLTERTQNIGRFTNEAREIFEGKDDEFGFEVVVLLNSNKTIPAENRTEVEQGAADVHSLMDRMYKYMTNNGMDIKHIDNYFPWVFDAEYLTSHREEFIELMSAENFKEKFTDFTPADLYTAISASNGMVDNHIDTEAVGHIPAMSAMNERTLRWMDDLATPEQRQQFGEFFSQELGHTLIVYIEQAVKRTEYSKRFGGGKLDKILTQARKQGATEKDIELGKTYVDAVMGTHGYRTNQKLAKVLGWEPPAPGEIINPKVQKTMGAIMVYQNLRVLAMATLTSLADPVGIAVRTGDIGMAFSAYKGGIKQAYKHARGDEAVLADIAEMLGVIDREMTVEALNWEYGGEYVTGTARKINEGFFRYIGLQSWTRATRLMGLHAGFRFIRRHVQNPNRQSQRLLDELNISAEDVVFDETNEVKVLTNEERKVLHEQDTDTAKTELARDDKVRNALHRFVDTSILRPNATLRPIWASDPHFMLVFHLKSFMYAFHEIILKRVALESKNGNMMPLLMLGMFIPVMMGIDESRELIKFGGEGNPRKANWGWDDHVWNAAERSGLYGLSEIAMDATRDIQMGGMGYESFSGPTIEQLDEMITSPNYQFSEAIPGQNVVKYWDFWDTP